MKRHLAIALITVAAGSACRETTLVPPRSLNSPTAIAVARGDVCLRTFEDVDRVLQFELEACGADERGAIGLVTNEQSDRLALIDLSIGSPRLIDLDPATPGPTHVEVGRLPVDVAASPGGTAAYTLNQLDRDVSVVNLWTPEPLSSRYNVDETPIAMDVDPVSGEVVVAAGSPSLLHAFPGVEFDGPGTLSDGSVEPADAESRTIELPGTVSDVVFGPGGDELWVVYRDQQFASVVSFAPTADGFDTACLNGIDAKPCVVSHVSLGAGCADGLDNDGDGLVDQQDPQCFGPRAAESDAGLGRIATGSCANGLDDDQDGLIDRDDPDCVFASGVEEAVASIEPPGAVCSDDVDNDGDGRVDYPSDDACYGALGRTEDSIRKLGFDTIGIDSHGVFAYVVDRVGEQILVIDARRKRLIDAPASQLPSAAAFDSEFGIDVSPSPLSVQGAIDRSLIWQDEADDHVVVRYDFGAWVAANNGTMQYIDTTVMFCEFTGEVVSNREFWAGAESEAEATCLSLPSFPLADATARVVAEDETLPSDCTSPAFVDCATCIEADGDEPCDACDAFAESQFDLCARAFVSEETKRYVNARFSLRDGSSDDGRVLGLGTCEQPDTLVEALQQFASDNPSAPQSLKCDSLLMPQPFAPAAALDDDPETLQELPRADLLQLRTLRFDTDAGNEPFIGFRPADQRIVTEQVSVTYEGTIPQTSRSDAVISNETGDDGSVWIDVGFNPCTTGVEVGDRFLFTSEPSADCAVAEDLEYEVVERTDSEVRIAPIEGLADEVPSRGCFDTAASYLVRASGEWVVVGETTGFLSPYEADRGACVPRFHADVIDSRVSTGETFVGPYYSFYLYPGVAAQGDNPVEPVRDTAYTFPVSSGFTQLLFPTCSTLGQRCSAGLFPAQVVWAPGLPAGSLLLSPDPNDNFIHIRNLDDASAAYTVVR